MNNKRNKQKSHLSLRVPMVISTLLAAMLGGVGVASAEAPPDGRIGYVLTYKSFAVYEAEDGSECPDGFNDGPRELYSREFPDDGTMRTVMDTQLMSEGRNMHPTAAESEFPYHEAQGNISLGLNLDGETGPNSYQSPEGEEGIDNQLFRAVACTMNYRAAGSLRHFANVYMWSYNNNRWVIELSDVDDLSNDDAVTVTTYRGNDPLLTHASGEVFRGSPGGTQNVDMRWGKDFIEHTQGKIVDGVLITEPIDQIMIPWSSTFNTSGYHSFRDLRFKLDLTPDSAEGLLAGYADVEAFSHHLKTTFSTHHLSYGQQSASLEYAALRRNADAYPDPETGINTAISMAVAVKMIQTFVLHPDEEVDAGQKVLTSN